MRCVTNLQVWEQAARQQARVLVVVLEVRGIQVVILDQVLPPHPEYVSVCPVQEHAVH